MPREILEFRVVVASPSDLFEMRRAVFEIIDEINRTFEVQRISVRGLGWEEYVTPGVSDEPQSVINESILQDYDVLIAMFATKLGTPTKTAGSGTVEEIEKALAREPMPLGKHSIQVYFRDKIENLSEIPIDELKRVSDFRNSLKARGVLYGQFKERDDLQREIRVNLQRPILDYLRARRPVDMVENTTKDVVATTELDHSTTASVPLTGEADDYGILDQLERSEQAIEIMNGALNTMARLMNEIADETNRQVAEIESPGYVSASAKEKKASINKFAFFLAGKAKELREAANTGDENFSIFVNTILFLAPRDPSRETEQYSESLANFLAGAETLLGGVAQARDGVIGYRNTLANIPRITVQFNQAKNALLSALDECLRFMDNTERKIYELTAGT